MLLASRSGIRKHALGLIWISGVSEAIATKRLDLRSPRGLNSPCRTFRWRHPRKSLAYCHQAVLLDCGAPHLLQLGQIHADTPCGGWGNRRDKLDVHQEWLAAPQPRGRTS